VFTGFRLAGEPLSECRVNAAKVTVSFDYPTPACLRKFQNMSESSLCWNRLDRCINVLRLFHLHGVNKNMLFELTALSVIVMFLRLRMSPFRPAEGMIMPFEVNIGHYSRIDRARELVKISSDSGRQQSIRRGLKKVS